MNHSVKTTTVVLGAIAAIAVWSFVEAATRQSGVSLQNNSANSTQETTGANPGDDPDHDGLINSDEIYWNTDPFDPDTDGDTFKDGEEVASGHDPSIPGPDDFTTETKARQNVTQKTSALVVAGLYEGSLKTAGSEYDTALDQLAEDAFEQARFNLAATPVPLLVVPTNPQTIQTYAQEMTQIITQTTSTLGDVSDFDKYNNNLVGIRERLITVFVPETWKERHRNFIANLDRLLNCTTALRQLEEDPLQALAAYRIAQVIVEQQIPTIIGEYYQYLIANEP